MSLVGHKLRWELNLSNSTSDHTVQFSVSVYDTPELGEVVTSETVSVTVFDLLSLGLGEGTYYVQV